MMFAGLYLEFSALVLGCVLMRRRWPGQYRLLVLLKVIAFVVQWGSTLYSEYTRSSNHWIWNLYWPAETIVYLYIFYKSAVHRLARIASLWLMASVPPLLILAYMITPEFFIINKIADIGSSVLLLLAACAAYIGLFLNRDDVPFFSQPVCWLAMGILFYSIGDSIYLVTLEMTRKMILFRFIMEMYFCTLGLLNICLIGCFVTVYRKYPAATKSWKTE